MGRFLRRNALSLVMFGAFAVFLVLQALTGWRAGNAELLAHGQEPRSLAGYLTSGGFTEATFENWESEFLQMGSYVLLTAYLVQRGSAESKPPGVRDEGEVRPESPWPVRRGGWWRTLYEHSLALCLLGLFAISFVLHLVGGTAEYNEEQALLGQPPVTVLGFLAGPEFWFQSMQNWQSEFLAVGVLVVASVYLRQRGSPQSKKVTAPHGETGD
ncbi:DUF6766 family protein [Longispora albida]|uniref:DUF6766 family protein n=1 Tax=Longispora albida TaxID=203523 RepID=UPI0003827174|nr:DUF6766 family protein [Longispora albida]